MDAMVIVLKGRDDGRYIGNDGQWTADGGRAAEFATVESAHAIAVLLELPTALVTLRFGTGEEVSRPFEGQTHVRAEAGELAGRFDG